MNAPEFRVRRGDGLEISDDNTRLNRDRVHGWLALESYWAAGRSREVFETSLVGSWCLGVYTGVDHDEQVAFARVVTDQATFAWVCDVFVDRSWRGRGVGTWLMREMVVELAHRRSIPRLLLATRDAHAIYAKAGFGPLEGAWRWMEIDRRPTREAILAAGPGPDPVAT